MAVVGRLIKASRALGTMASSKTLNPPSPFLLSQNIAKNPRLLHLRPVEQQNYSNASEIQWPKWVPNSSRLSFILPALLASFLGVEGLQTAYADAEEPTARPTPSESPASYVDLEEIAKKERQRIEELLKAKGIRYGSYPRFTLAIKGQKVTVKFQIPPACEVSRLIASLASQLGLKVEQHGGGSDMSLRAWDSAVSWQLTLTRPDKQNETGGNEGEGDLCILIFGSLVTPDKAELEFIKKGSLNAKELDAFVSVLQLAGEKLKTYNSSERKQMPSTDKSVSSLESMGVRVYGIDEPILNSDNNEISWENIAGYHQQKREIEDTILLALQKPDVYDDIARGTRRKFESNRPRAVLLKVPQVRGKTSSARVIANQAGVPMLYVPLEVVMSKYYGESERLLAKVFSLANELPNGAIIFLDEVDSFAIARDGEMHEATRRVLSVLLRQIRNYGNEFERSEAMLINLLCFFLADRWIRAGQKVVVIAATNRKQDLDPALISRFDSMITFGLPDRPTRREIAAQYAKHLSESELGELAAVTDEMSGRDIRDVCQQAERSWASKIIRGQASKDGERGLLPPLKEYIESAVNRRKGLSSIFEAKIRSGATKYQVVVD